MTDAARPNGDGGAGRVDVHGTVRGANLAPGCLAFRATGRSPSA